MSIQFTQRTDTYLAEARHDKPKQVFRLLAGLMEDAGLTTPGTRFLDVGCATGEMIFFLCHTFPSVSYTGIDNQAELLSHARTHPGLLDARFVEADALVYRDAPSDVVTCFGMLGIFDEFQLLLASLLANARSGGRIFVHGLFNPDDIDVRVYYKDHRNGKDWNRGFNIFSMKQVADWLAPQVQSCRFIPFVMESDIPRRPETPHRASTTKLDDGRRVTINGLCLMLPEHVLEIVV